jgi:hypothetical protein
MRERERRGGERERERVHKKREKKIIMMSTKIKIT